MASTVALRAEGHAACGSCSVRLTISWRQYRLSSPIMNDNPYLAHLNSSKKGAANGNVSAKEPLFGFLPRHVKGAQVVKAMVRLATFSLSEEYLIKPVAGRRRQSIHEEISLSAIQEDLRIAKETACVHPDGRIPEDGESINLSSHRGAVIGCLWESILGPTKCNHILGNSFYAATCLRNL